MGDDNRETQQLNGYQVIEEELQSSYPIHKPEACGHVKKFDKISLLSSSCTI